MALRKKASGRRGNWGKWGRIFPWIPVLMVVSIIFYSSSQPYEKQDLRGTLTANFNLEWVKEKYHHVSFTYDKKEISIKNLGVAGFVEFFIRKASHFTIFLLLAFFAYRAFRLQGVSRGNGWAYTLLLTMVYAISDEFHQKFTGGRTPLLDDVVIDSFGGLFGIGVAQLVAVLTLRSWK